MPCEQHPADQHRRPFTVVLIDDEPLIRAALARLLAEAGLGLVGEAATAEDGIQLALDLRPDVVLIDIDVPGVSGIDAIERIKLISPGSRILVLTRPGKNRVAEAIIAGASGYMLKTASPEVVIAAVMATAGGESVLSPQVAGKLLERIRDRLLPITEDGQDAADAIRATLTERELEIFVRLASGRHNQAIAQELSLSTHTVANHVASILAKLHLENRTQAAVVAVRSGIS